MKVASDKVVREPSGFQIPGDAYRLLIEKANDAVLVADVETGLILDANPQACVVLGRPRKEVLKLRLPQIYLPDQAGLYDKQLRALIAERKSILQDVIIRRPDGSDIPIRLGGSVTDCQGRLIVMVVLRDVSSSREPKADIGEREKAEQALRDSEEKLKAIVHGSPIPQFVINRDHKVVQWNRPLEEISGVKEKDVIGTDLHWKAFYNQARPCLCDLLVDGKEDGIPVWYAGKSKKSRVAPEAYEATDYIALVGRWLRFMAATIRDSKGNVIGAVETLEDITERKKYEDALLEAQKHLQAIHDTSPDLIFIHDLEGRILDVNEVVVRSLGFSRAELLGAHVSDISGGGFTQDRAVEYIRMAAQGMAQDFEWVCRKKDGTEFPAEVRLRGFEHTASDGKGVQSVLAIVRDISERKHAESERVRLEGQLLHAQKMESIGRLAGGIAHDFNNLLTPILGYSDLLLSELTPPDPRYESVCHIRKAADRAKDLTRQLLSFGRRQTLELRPVDMADIVQRFEPMLRRTIREDIDLVIDIGSDVNYVRADMGQIEQILMNLAVNAQDAMPNGGLLTRGVEGFNLDEDSAEQYPNMTPGEYVMLSVSDTGVGMSAATQRRLFDPFFTTKEVGKGTGLGLSTVYGIVKQHGGFVSVYSEVGKGSVFKLYFPRISKPVVTTTDAATGREEPRSGKGEVVLIVEDNPMVRDLACEVLRRLGYHVISADSSDSAFHVADVFPGKIDLLLTDIVLPNMTGQEIGRQLCARREGLKVLYMSGFAGSITHDGVLEEGLNFIQKPLTHESLSKMVRKVLDSK